MMKGSARQLIYIGYYDTDSNAGENRNFVLAARSKMDYIINVLRRTGRNVLVVSASQTLDRKGYAAKTIASAPGVRLRLFRTLAWGGRTRRALSRLQMRAFLLAWLLLRTGREDEVIVYHSLGYASIIGLAHRLKRFRLVLEVEEVYAHLSGRQADLRVETGLFRRADAFIFPTIRMNSSVNRWGRPYVVAHGAYTCETSRKCGQNDGLIHVVYAGTFDPRKGGARTAILSAMSLDCRYHLHIIGSGNREDTNAVRTLADQVSAATECAITLEGAKTGEEYIRFVQSCQIGLSTQRPDPAYCDTSFPSKILSYMANGLRVVSVRIPVVEESAVGDLVYYYDADNGDSVANAIMGVDLSAPYDSRERIRELDVRFERELKRLLGQHSSPDAHRTHR